VWLIRIFFWNVLFSLQLHNLALHVVAMILLTGTITIVDLRLIGVTSRRWAITEVARDTLTWTWIAFATSVVTGLLMVMSKAGEYFLVPAFWMKFVFMACAAANMVIFEFLTFRNVHAWDLDHSPPRAAKIAGFLSLFFWGLVIIMGR
jgi:hypothetical protein